MPPAFSLATAERRFVREANDVMGGENNGSAECLR